VPCDANEGGDIHVNSRVPGLGTSWCGHHYASTSSPSGEEPPVPVKQETGWTADVVWNEWNVFLHEGLGAQSIRICRHLFNGLFFRAYAYSYFNCNAYSSILTILLPPTDHRGHLVRQFLDTNFGQ